MLRIPIATSIVIVAIVAFNTPNAARRRMHSGQWSGVRIVDGRSGSPLTSLFEGHRPSKQGISWLLHVPAPGERGCGSARPGVMAQLWGEFVDLFSERIVSAQSGCDASEYLVTQTQVNLPAGQCPSGQTCNNCASDTTTCTYSTTCVGGGTVMCSGCNSAVQGYPCGGCYDNSNCSSTSCDCVSCGGGGGCGEEGAKCSEDNDCCDGYYCSYSGICGQDEY
jgi:hypothetical protein